MVLNRGVPEITAVTPDPTVCDAQIKTVWVLGDQLLRRHPALEDDPKNIVVLLIESQTRLAQMGYQKKKLVLLLSAMRHYALWLSSQGYTVDYRKAEDFLTGIKAHVDTHTPDQLTTIQASEYKTRQFQQQLGNELTIPVHLLPNTQFLVEHYTPYPDPVAGKKYVMENFYRLMRKHFKVLMTEQDQPVGGAWNFDKLNRAALPRKIEIPNILTFAPDALTTEVIEQVESLPGVGQAQGFSLGVTHAQAEAALAEFIQERLPNFGSYEDAMTTRSRTIFHSLLSPYLNIGLLEPLQLIRAAEQAYIQGHAPLNSVEGFIRQILGWREYIYWQYWQQMPGLATVNHWQFEHTLPQFFWDAQTEMNCLHQVVKGLLETGYSHHIERLMLVCNYCILAGIKPQEVSDWFLTMYIDAYEWVVLPNVLGMGLNADGGKTATKPYIATANYINKMGDYCQGCRYDPKQRIGENACPFNFLYWNFLITHEVVLRANPRLGPNVLGLAKVSAQDRIAIAQQALSFTNGPEPV